MIPLLLSVALASGVYLVYAGISQPRAHLVAPERLVSVREFLVRAGLHGITPGQFVLFSIGSCTLSALVAQVFLGWGLLSALAAAILDATR